MARSPARLMSRDEVAELLGIAPSAVRSTLRRWGVRERRGYVRVEVAEGEARRTGQGRRTDLEPDEAGERPDSP